MTLSRAIHGRGGDASSSSSDGGADDGADMDDIEVAQPDDTVDNGHVDVSVDVDVDVDVGVGLAVDMRWSEGQLKLDRHVYGGLDLASILKSGKMNCSVVDFK